MQLSSVLQKSDTVNDADPNTSAPAASRVHAIEQYADSKYQIPTGGVLFRLRVKTAGGAAAAGGAADAQLFVKDRTSGLWFKIGGLHAAVPNDDLRHVMLPPGIGDHDVFVQLANVTGTGAASVELACGAAAATGKFEKDGTMAVGLRPRGFATGNGFYARGFKVTSTVSGTATLTGEDGNAVNSVPLNPGDFHVGPVTVSNLTTATILGYK